MIDITTIKLQEIGFMRINVSLDYLFESMDYKKSVKERPSIYPTRRGESSSPRAV